MANHNSKSTHADARAGSRFVCSPALGRASALLLVGALASWLGTPPVHAGDTAPPRSAVAASAPAGASPASSAPSESFAPSGRVGDVLSPPVLIGDTTSQAPTWDGAMTAVSWLLELDPDGTVSGAQRLEPKLADEAKDARLAAIAEPYVRGLRFAPARRNGVAVPARIRFQHLLVPRAPTEPNGGTAVPAPSAQPPDHVAPSTDAAVPPAPSVSLADEHPAVVTSASAAPPAARVAARVPARGPEQEYGASAAIDAPLQATSSLNLSGTSLRRRPYFNAGDLLNGAPGFYVVQHGGGGKAQQYFLRGFDADHGTDVGLFVDDVPINLPTHGHGQGYSDLNWIIPELVETIEVRKGPFFAEFGDHAVAGSVNYRLRTDLPQSFVTGSVGMFDTYRAVAAARFRAVASTPIFAAEVYRTNGPFTLGERYRRMSLFARGSQRVSDGTFTWTAQTFSSAWHAAGQIPVRAVEAGAISRFGSIDPNEGGSSQRHSLALDYRARVSSDAEVHVTGWLARNRLLLYSNFSLYSVDQQDGDMVRQSDDRVYAGMRASWVLDRRVRALRVLTRVGTQARYDLSRPSVSHAPRRIVRDQLSASSVDELAAGVFGELDLRYSHWLRAVAGARYDTMLAQVQDELSDAGSAERSGERFSDLVSPKLSLIFHPHRVLDLYANFGSGFHSNDARGVVLRGDARVDPFARALAYELGARLMGDTRWQLSWSGYLVDLASETVFVGDDGSSEPRGKTRRIGTELNGTVQLLPWLKWDGSVSYSHAAFVDNAGNADSVALAPRWLLQSGVEAEHPSGISGRVSLLHVGDRPATEDGALTAEGFVRLDATLEYRRQWYGLSLAVQNLTDASYRQAQFASVTRLPGESAESSCPRGTRPVSEGGTFVGCEDVTFTPGLPITVLGSASVYF
jgi:outer membrane receptor protein involved in Fe transport